MSSCVSDKTEILVIGSTVADVIVNVDVLPATAQDIHVKSQTVSLGGCAYNVSAMIDLFGVPYTLFSPVGKVPSSPITVPNIFLKRNGLMFSIPTVLPTHIYADLKSKIRLGM